MKEYQKEALKIAKKSILEHYWKDSFKNDKVLNKELLEEKASFVTLKSFWKNLRWCIWNIEPVWSLYNSIISNAKSSAFRDPRFKPLSRDELYNNNIYIEITILWEIQEKKFLSIEELLKFLKENKPWLVIKLENKKATFLPSVWKEIENEEDFLLHLIYKAGIDKNQFMDNFADVKISFYTWEEFWEYFNNI